MCTFITAVLPAAADADAVAALFRAHGRAFGPGAMYATRTGFLAPGECAFHTTPGHCDCGTPLGRSTWRSGRDTSGSRRATTAPSGEPAPTSLAEWVALIDAVMASGATSSLGLYWENTPGADDESVSSTPRTRISRSSLDEAVLAGMAGGVIHDFVR